MDSMIKKYNRILLLIIIAISLASIGTVFAKAPSKNMLGDTVLSDNISLIKKRYLDVCVSDRCHIKAAIFPTYNYKIEDADLLEIVEKINKEYINSYNDMENSVITDSMSECKDKKDIYKYKYYYNLITISGENEDYLSVLLEKQKSNLCDSDEFIKPTVYTIFYDKKNKKELSLDEIKKIYKVDNEKLNNMIKADYNGDETELDLSNIYFFLDNEKKLNVYYYSNETKSWNELVDFVKAKETFNDKIKKETKNDSMEENTNSVKKDASSKKTIIIILVVILTIALLILIVAVMGLIKPKRNDVSTSSINNTIDDKK